ncbi:LysR family transcriptional regulator [Cellvibrio polysaccharolyticus]|uniref:LysR family transcriptional regulator n=1 Tax=Cellvibrio polysaccharolyticus TaxID=2082724 RepID=A0A928V373_9GAMM|nr:LysR family transcriptional regulator [Cellvibrio polysaccharolyticus]MBE8715727.1 LysR family transcriptional regulator [Cellvibrio polysaccharolyticus]
MEIEDLRTFIEVADAGGVSPAARRLGIAKSIVSRRLIRLEKELGIQLLARTTRGAAITEAGVTFREHAARICAELDLAHEMIFPGGDLRGRLRIAAPLTFGPSHLAPVFAELARQHPALQLHACYTDRYVDLVADGFDCGIRLGYLADSSLIARRVVSMRGSLVATPGYLREHGEPETPEALLAHDALLQGTESWRFMDGDKIVTIHPRGRFKADNGLALATAALAGLGIAALPDFLIADHLASGALKRIMTRYPPPEAGLYVVWPPTAHPPRKIRALIDLLIERLG